MGLDIKNAIKSELKITGTQKDGKYIRRRTFYTFLCIDCKNEFTSQQSDLSKLSGRCRKCADRHSAAIKGLKFRKRPFEALYNKFIYDRIRFNQITDLSFEDFLEFTKINKCHYCNNVVEWIPFNLTKYHSRYNLDRKDNNIGYIKLNLVVCCWDCNELKSNKLTYIEMKEIAKLLNQLRNNL